MMRRLTVWLVVVALLAFGGAPALAGHAATGHGMGGHHGSVGEHQHADAADHHCAPAGCPESGHEPGPAAAPLAGDCAFCPAFGCGGVALPTRSGEAEDTGDPRPVVYAAPADEPALGLALHPPQQPPERARV